jgi:diaminopimelate decarboxylase
VVEFAVVFAVMHVMHVQAASLGELQQALHVGFPPDRIVFDSPAKTRSELR